MRMSIVANVIRSWRRVAAPSTPRRRVDISKGRLVPVENSRNQDQREGEQLFRLRNIGALAIVTVLCTGVLLLSGCAISAPAAQAIEIESVRMTAAGHFIDLRYRVLDPVRANELLGPGIKPTLTDEKTGAVMAGPMTAKLGSLRQTRGEQRSDRSYFVLFANTAGIAPGSRVTADLGGMTFRDLVVE